MRKNAPIVQLTRNAPVSPFRQFDFLNFFYGVGAAVVLLAAVFKFSGAENADTIFVIGVCVEGLVFLVSAFRWKELFYKWENVFPELVKEEAVANSTLLSLQSSVTNLTTLAHSLEAIGSNAEVLLTTLQKVNQTTEKLSLVQEEMYKTTGAYLDELTKLKSRLKNINEKVHELGQFGI